jgi:oxygen-dependent protoporphyrinogen oxidase
VWPKAIPQYVLGYGRFKEIADDIERRNPGLLLAGAYRDGIALGDAVRSAEQAAVRASQLLGVGEPATSVQHPVRSMSGAGPD